MKQILDCLAELQNLELSGARRSAGSDEVRKKVPVQVLEMYDRLRARGKKGVADVRRGVCAQCHMQVAVGLLALLRREDNLHRCENCGAYLRLNEETPALEMPPRRTQPGRRGRPRKLDAHAV